MWRALLIDPQRLGCWLDVVVSTVAVRLEEQLVIGGHIAHTTLCASLTGLVPGPDMRVCGANCVWSVERSSGVKSAVIDHGNNALPTTGRWRGKTVNNGVVGRNRREYHRLWTVDSKRKSSYRRRQLSMPARMRPKEQRLECEQVLSTSARSGLPHLAQGASLIGRVTARAASDASRGGPARAC